MPYKENNELATRVYMKEPTGLLKWERISGGICPTGSSIAVDPEGNTCVTEGEYLTYTPPSLPPSCFKCTKEYNLTEVTHWEDINLGLIHKRILAVFSANGGSGGSSQTRTWGVEYITEPTAPERTGYAFKGWATSSGATTPNVTFPILAPNSNKNYYAVWEVDNKTIKPELYKQETGGFPSSTQVRALNKDPSGRATIRMDVNTIPPVTTRGNIPYNDYTSWVTVSQTGVYVTVYATAQVSGKAESDVVSIYTG